MTDDTISPVVLWYNLLKNASDGGAVQMNGVKNYPILDGTTLKIIAMISMVSIMRAICFSPASCGPG